VRFNAGLRPMEFKQAWACGGEVVHGASPKGIDVASTYLCPPSAESHPQALQWQRPGSPACTSTLGDNCQALLWCCQPDTTGTGIKVQRTIETSLYIPGANQVATTQRFLRVINGNKVVTKNDVAFGLWVSAVMASLSAEMKLPSDSISDIDSPWLCESWVDIVVNCILWLQGWMAQWLASCSHLHPRTLWFDPSVVFFFFFFSENFLGCMYLMFALCWPFRHMAARCRKGLFFVFPSRF